MKKLPIALTLLASAGMCLAYEPAGTLADLQKLQEKVERVSTQSLPATVSLVSERTGSSGSGVIVSEDGLILTAAHVVQGMKEVDVYFSDGKKWLGKVLGANFSKDIGMVKMVEAGPWPHVQIGESKPLEAGDWVIALGHSAGFDPARTPPVRFGRVMSDGPGNYFTTDCTLIGGDSGGPLFEMEGRLIGIHSRVGAVVGVNMHVPVKVFTDNWDRMLKSEFIGEGPFAEKPEKGKGFLGLATKDVEGGIEVTKVGKKSPAEEAGIKEGDLLRTLNGEKLDSRKKLQSILAELAAGDKLALEITRDGKDETINLKLGKR